MAQYSYDYSDSGEFREVRSEMIADMQEAAKKDSVSEMADREEDIMNAFLAATVGDLAADPHLMGPTSTLIKREAIFYNKTEARDRMEEAVEEHGE